MKTFFSEYRMDYSSYTFGYTAYCLKEPEDKYSDIYNLGFLPFTGEARIQESIFYMARSFRVNLSAFSNTSENRRILRKVSDLDLSFQVFIKEDFDIQDPNFRKICLTYAAERFDGNQMTEKRFNYVLSQKTATHIFEYRLSDKPFGYILTCIDERMVHYWFAFFDVQLMTTHSIGKWMMWSVIDWAKEKGLDYAYLGTVYNKKSLYKIRDFKGSEYFDGSTWNGDMKALKILCKTDDQVRNIDRFKEQDSFANLLEKLS